VKYYNDQAEKLSCGHEAISSGSYLTGTTTASN
jgi:hypothetical protein